MRTLPDSGEASPETAQHDSQVVVPCTYCGSDTRADMVRAAFWGRQGLLAIEDIPARVCQRCGEQFYDDQTAQRIENIVDGSGEAPTRQILVPVFSMATPAGPGVGGL
ncbi:MAG: type II toxin-antitoxin system MqsA family antitoxin [Thermoguttaceae bacterium]|jgi:YgiT-type zinc finger domain-containing protein